MRLRLRYRWILPLSIAALCATGCEEELADGTRSCLTWAEGECPAGYVCRRNACPDGRFYCYRQQPGDRETFDGPVCVVDGQCEPNACENILNCAEDCGAHCDVAAMTQAVPSDVLVAEIRAPLSTPEAREMGLDLDGDGEGNNKLGSIINLFSAEGLLDDPNSTLAERIHDGELLVVGRLWREDALASPEPRGLVQLLGAEPIDATPIFDGHDVVAISSEASQDVFLCGVFRDGVFVSEPSPQPLRLPLPLAVPGGGTFVATIEAVRIEGRVDADGWMEVKVGGGITERALEQEFFPWLAEQMNLRVQREPDDWASVGILDLLDDNCEPTLPECDPKPVGCSADEEVSVDELRCSAFLNSALAPDVDLDGDGERDLLSVGYLLVSAVPVSVVE